MANENKRISIFFSRTLGAPLRNARWSWGAINPTTGQLFLRIWEDQRKTVDGVPCFLILSGRWGSTSRGVPERREHIEVMKRGTPAFGVVQVAKRVGGGGRAIESFDSNNLIQFGRVVERGESVYAAVAGQVSVSALEGRKRIPTGITAEDVRDALASLDRRDPHPFGESTGYDLVEGGKRYPPKAVLGLAARRILGHSLRPRDFTGGEESECFRVLRDLGFTIEPKPEAVTPGDDWTEEEIRALVEDYFAMLRMDRSGLPYSKAEHNRALQERLHGRLKGAIEYKYRNVSGVLDEERFPYIPGYKPARNYQRRILPDIVLEYLGAGEDDVAELEHALDDVGAPPLESIDFGKCEVPPPERDPELDQITSPSRPRRARKFDQASKDAANRKLGRAGEEFIVRRERWYLRSRGRADLAEQVEWVSDTRGDGLGYDILSFDPTNGAEIYIEVKTTNCGQDFPFYASQGEVDASIELGANYRLYRVFNFSTAPQFYVVPGGLDQGFSLRARTYEVRRA